MNAHGNGGSSLRAKSFLRALSSDDRVVALGSFLLGGVAVSIWPQLVGSIALGLFVAAVVRRLVQIRREHQAAEALTEFETALRQPSRDAMARMRAEDEHFLVFDGVIEVLPHPRLSSLARFASLGWAPEDIEVTFQNDHFDASPILDQVGGKQGFDPPNGRKFSLVNRSLGGTDAGLSLFVSETDYFTIQSVRSKLSFELREQLGSLDPEHNHIPHSLCLHFLIRCGDGSVLCLRNEDRKAYASGAWSVSGEEQLNDFDLSQQHPVEALFQRALLEEIFGLCDDQVPLDTRWSEVASLVSSMRVWSLFVEEDLNNFSLFGVCQLSATPDSLREKITKIINAGSSARDLEGKLHVMSEEALERLLIDGDATATGLFSCEIEAVVVECLHGTTRYRIFRLLRALRGGPLTPQ